MLCLNCKKTFPDRWNERKAQNTLEFGQFLDNQRAIIFDEKPKHKKHYKKRVFEHQCPHCGSNWNVNATVILEKFNVKSKSGKQIPYKRLYNMPQYAPFVNYHKMILKSVENL